MADKGKYPINFILFLFAVSTALSSCASSVKPSLEIASMKEDSPYSIIKIFDMKKDYVTSSISGVYSSPSDYPDNFKPVKSSLSTAGGIAKLAYGLTPMGMLTHAVHLGEGPTVKIPSGKIGIAINHKYYKTLKHEKISYMVGSTVYEGYYTEYEHKNWDSVIWVSLEENQEYKFKISILEITGPNGKVPVQIASDRQLQENKSQPEIKKMIQDKNGEMVEIEDVENVKEIK